MELRVYFCTISPTVWTMCEHLHYESVYFKELHNRQYTEREQLQCQLYYQSISVALSFETSKQLSPVSDASEHGQRKDLKKLFTSIKKKKERRTALVIGKMPKLGNSYNLLREAYYEASLPFLLDC